MRNPKCVVMVLILTMGAASFAGVTTRPAATTLPAPDTFTVLEAKRRGVAVEVVQLEHVVEANQSLTAQIAALNVQVFKLKKELAQLKAEAEERRAKLVDEGAVGPESVEEAIRDHRIVSGMTLDQAKRAIVGNWTKNSDIDGVLKYSCKWPSPDAGPGDPVSIEVAWVELENGRVVHSETKPNLMKNLSDAGSNPGKGGR